MPLFCLVSVSFLSRLFKSPACKRSRKPPAAITCLVLAAIFCMIVQTAGAQSKTGTSTSLAITSGGNAVSSVAAGSVVTLTARVKAGGAAVTPGQVNFCDASAKTCTDIHLLGTAQLTAAGTATLKLRPGIGSHSYKALFPGTNAYAGSASGASTLTATGTIPPLATSTTMSQTGSWGAYTLSATVRETGNTAPPTGTVSFLDTDHGNAVLGTGTLGAATRGVKWSAVNSSVPGVAAVSYAVADLNGDGIPDLFVKDYFGTYDVLLGNADGTFYVGGSGVPFGPYSETGSFVVGDFNNDGIPDVAAINAQYYTPNGTITIFLGNGDGTFTVAASGPTLGLSPGGIAVADLNGDGNADLAVSQTDSSGNGQVAVFFGNGDGTFTPASSTTALSSTAATMIPADINRDGKMDLVLTGNGQSGVTILLGKGDGTFTVVAGPTEAGEATATVADVNNDGIPDLVFPAATTSYLSVFLGNGDGTFTEAPSSPNANVKLGSSFTIGDFNQDGIPDIVYAIPYTTSAGVLFGKGDGSFVPTPATFTVPEYFSGAFVVADFNGDGWPDVLWLDGSGRTVDDLLTHPTETAIASATVSLAAAGTHLADASYPGDSNYNASTSGTLPLWGAPSATTTALRLTAAGKAVSSVAAGTAVTLTATVVAGTSPVTAGQVNFCDASATYCSDIHLLGTASLNNTGHAAFKFVPGPGTHSYKAMFVANGYGTTSSSAAVPLTVGPAPAPVYTDTAAISLDGYPGDYSLTATITGYGGTAAPTGKVSFLDTSFGNASLGSVSLGAATAGTAWRIQQTAAANNFPESVVAGDFNGDGIPDLAVLWVADYYGGSYSFTVYLGKGDGTFTTGQTYAVTSNTTIQPYMIAGDFNGDGKTDLAFLTMNIGGNNTNFVTVFPGAGDGTFGPGTMSNALVQKNEGGEIISGSMVAADFNGDGKLDIAVTGACVDPCGVTILLGQGDGSFTATTYFPDKSLGKIAVGDFNGDGFPDLMGGGYFNSDSGVTLLGKGDGSFAAQSAGVVVDSFASGAVTGDFNGDGVLDVAFGYTGAVVVLLGKGDGTFTRTADSQVPGSGEHLVVGDFNNDGKADLAGVDNYNDAINLFTGVGDGSFTVASTFPIPGSYTGYNPSFQIAAADFNGDGVPDLALVTVGESAIFSLITEPTQTATATLTGVAPVGAGTHDVKAKYPGDTNYPSAVSGTITLYAGLKPVTITPAGGTFSSVQTVTMTESISGATIYYLASGAYNSSGWVQYTGPLSLSTGGQVTITAYATENGYDQSSYTTVTFTLNLPAAPTPVISPSGGLFAGSQSVTITDSASGATIYYTTDGTPPGTYSTVYTGPITVSTSETIAAIAAAGGYSASPLASAQFFIQSSQSRFIYTVAGSGFWGFGGDGGPAAQADLNDPTGTAIDAAGNLYIADIGNQVVRKVDAASGTIFTVAGTGIAGYSGDGGPATSAQLYWPYAVALDSTGNLYISDSGNRVVRRVDAASGAITTYAGSTSATTLGDGGPATSAELFYPQGIAFDKAGNLYIGDETRVRTVNAGTGFITTVAGSGAWGFSGDGGPATSAWLTEVEGIALDRSGNLYIADIWNAAIRKVTAATGIITTVAGQGGWSGSGYSGDGGPATIAKLDGPQGVAVDVSGNLYIADTYNYVLREVTAVDGIINTISGRPYWCTTLSGDGGPAAESALCFAPGVTLDGNGNLYVAEEGFGRIRKITPPIAPPSKTTAKPAFDVAAGTYSAPQTLTMTDATPGAEIFVTVNGGRVFPIGQGYYGPIGITGSASIQAVAVAPGYLPSDPVSAAYTITTPPTSIINTFAGNGTIGASGIGGPATGAGIGYPIGIAFDGAGNLYIADQNNSVVWMVSAATGKISVAAGIPGARVFTFSAGAASSTALDFPQQVAFDTAGNLYISDEGFEQVLKVDAKTGLMTVYAGVGSCWQNIGDGGPATQACVYPSGLAFDKAGNLCIADNQNGRVRKVSAQTGIITTVAGGGTTGLGDGGPATSATLYYPGPIVFDSKGNLFIGERNRGRVRLVDAQTQIITTFAGNGNYGATGDGGSATSAEVYPGGLTVDSADNLYLSNGEDGIRMVPAGGGVITRVVGVGYTGFGGDGGAASMAELCGQQGMAFDKAGSLYIADSCNYRVRKVTYPGPAATPAFSLAAGAYTGTQTVTITDTAQGAAIYYTTDGSTPTTGSTLYDAPLTVSSSETLKAIAVATGYTVSAVASADYVIKQKVAPTVTWATPAPIAYGTPLGSAQLNATAAVAGSFVYSPAAGTVLDPGQQVLSTTFTPTDTADYLTATGTVTLTVNKAAPDLSAVQSSLNPAMAGNAVTFTVSVSSSLGSPSGTVAFMDGAAELGSATLSSGSATYATSTLAAGSHSITAVYSGDDKFASITSAALTQVVESFSIAVSSGSSSTATVSPGGQATYTLTVAPPAAGDALTFSVAGLPAGATAAFSPSTVAAGAAATNVTLTIAVPASAAAQPTAQPFRGGAWPMALGLLLLPFARRLRKASRTWLSLLLLMLAGLTICLGVSACGGSSKKTPPPPQTYTLNVTAASGTLTQSTKLTLLVQQ